MKRNHGSGLFRNGEALEVKSKRITDMWPLLCERDQTQVIGMHRHYEREFAQLPQRGNPESVAFTIHALIDEEVRLLKAHDPKSADIQCRKGCSHCCKQNVTVTEPEGVLLLFVARELGLPLDWARIARQAQHAGAAHWHRQPPEDWACTFLGADGTCTVYDWRPAACRKHFALSPPADCDPAEHPEGKTLDWVCLAAEIIASAAMVAFESVSMPVMLQRLKGGA